MKLKKIINNYLEGYRKPTGSFLRKNSDFRIEDLIPFTGLITHSKRNHTSQNLFDASLKDELKEFAHTYYQILATFGPIIYTLYN